MPSTVPTSSTATPFDINTLLPQLGLTIFQSSCLSGNPALVSTFLLKGDIHKQTQSGESPLFLAVSSASNRWTSGGCEAELAQAVVRLLLQAGSKVNTPTRTGLTPLQEASRKGCTAMVLLLLDWGASEFTMLPPPHHPSTGQEGLGLPQSLCSSLDVPSATIATLESMTQGPSELHPQNNLTASASHGLSEKRSQTSKTKMSSVNGHGASPTVEVKARARKRRSRSRGNK